MATKKTKVELSAETSKYEKSMRNVQRVSKKTSQHISRAWKTASIAVVAATAAMGTGIKLATDASSNLQEVQGKFDVVFAGQEKQAENMAKILVGSYAMSIREAKQYMSSIQDLLVPMGMQADAALRMSGEVVKLSADLASFNNLPTAQVMLDIQSALVGNFETMKKYGVILNEHVLKQKAFEMGLYSGKGMVDANVKALVAYELIIKSSTAAIGDQQRTMGSYANQMKQLTSNIEDLSAIIGDEFLPIATDAINQINIWVKTNDNLIRQKIPVYFSEIKDSIQRIWNVITYNPAIIEYGLIGLAFFGKEGWKYVAYIAAAAHLMTLAKTLSQALGLVSGGVLDISQVATANFKELQELVERFDFPDPFLDLQLQAKQLEERIEQLKKVTTGRIFTFSGDKEELVKLQNELIETQSKIAEIKTLAGLKVPSRLDQALATPDKYYGGSAPGAPEMKGLSGPTDKQIAEMKARYVKYWADIEAIEDEADMRAIMRERERLKELEPITAKRHEIWLSGYEAEEARLDEYASYRTGQEKSIAEQIRAIRMTDKTFALAALKEKYENYKNFTDDLIGLELWRAAKEKEIRESGTDDEKSAYDDMTNAMTGWANNFSSTLNDMLWGAEVTFKSIAESFSKMITQMMIQQSLIAPLFGGGSGWFGTALGWLSGLGGGGAPGGTGPITFAAQGGIFPYGISGYSNQIVNKPTQFAFARGAGLMGERGPEAIMPLTRTHGGDLGIKIEDRSARQPAGGGDTTIVIVANDAKSFGDMVNRNPESIIAIVGEALEERTGLLDTIRNTL